VIAAIMGDWEDARKQMEGESKSGHTNPQTFRQAIDGLRCATKRDDGQVASATDER
jgi:hypothetical protein